MGSGGLPITIDGSIVSTAEIVGTDSFDSSWEFLMDTVEIKGSNVPGLRQALDAGLKLRTRSLGNFLESNIDSYSNPRPKFTVTYLSKDGNFRINRDQDGKVFVYTKEKSDNSTAPTSYDSIDSDLGLLNLLGGFNDAVT